MLQPVRDHLAKDPEAAKLCKQVRQYATQAAAEKAKAEEKAKEEAAKGEQKADAAASLPPPANP